MTLARVRTVMVGVAGTPWYSNLYFMDDGGTSVAPQAVAAVGTFWTTMAAAISNNVTGTVQGEVARINEVDGQLTGVENVTPVAFAGGNTDDELPWQTQLLGRTFTAGFVNGRRVRGRIFIPGMVENNNAVGVPVASLQTSLQNALNALIAEPNTILAVWARPFAGDPAAVPPKPARLGTKYAVVTASVSPIWSVLRSRRD